MLVTIDDSSVPSLFDKRLVIRVPISAGRLNDRSETGVFSINQVKILILSVDQVRTYGFGVGRFDRTGAASTSSPRCILLLAKTAPSAISKNASFVTGRRSKPFDVLTTA